MYKYFTKNIGQQRNKNKMDYVHFDAYHLINNMDIVQVWYIFHLINTLFNSIIIFSINRKQGDGLFLKTCEQVSKLYPKIKFEGMIVDNTCMQVLSGHVTRLTCYKDSMSFACNTNELFSLSAKSYLWVSFK